MPIDTTAARNAVTSRTLTHDVANHVEDMAEAVVDLAEARGKLGIGGDVWESVKSSAAYRNMDSTERTLLASVYGELLGNASGGLGGAAGVGGATATEAEVVAAYHEVGDVLERMDAMSRAHGPGVVVPNPSAPGFNLDDFPQLILEHAHRVRVEQDGGQLFVLATFDTGDLDSRRTRYNVARSDVTPESFHAALRKVLQGAFANVEIRVQTDDEFRRGIPADRIEAPTATPPPAATRAERFSDAADLLRANLSNIPELDGLIASVEAGTAEMAPILNVRSSLPESSSFQTLRPDMMEAIASFLEDNGFADLVDRNYLGNGMQLVSRDGAFGI
jgi:hypothetical protein